ncbi:MAG: hypothetical protein AAFU41_15750 [Pseudomonadota bacterium]
MRALSTLVLFAGLALILFALGTVFQVSIDANDRRDAAAGSFQQEVGSPLRLAVFGDATRAQAFRGALAARDTNGLINHDVAVENPTDADAVVFLLDAWPDIANAPWQDRFQFDYTVIRDSDDDSFSLSLEDENRPLLRTFYNLGAYPEWDVDCFAAFYMHQIGAGPGEGFTPPDACPL